MQAIELSLIPVAAMAVGCAVTAVKPPAPQLRSALQHFAAGVVFAVVAVELLPDLRQMNAGAWTIATGFGAGVLIMLLVQRLGEPTLVAVGLDFILDGMLLGIAFAAGVTEGNLLALALSLELLSLGVALTLRLRDDGRSWRVVGWPITLALFGIVGGTWAGSTLLQHVSTHLMAAVLALGSAALLFLVTEDLLIEAHEIEDTTWATAMFFAGFLLLLIVGTHT